MEILTNKIKINYENINEKYDVIMLKVPYNNKDKSIFEDVNRFIDSIDFSKVFAIYRKGSGFSFYVLTDKLLNVNLEEIFSIDLYKLMINKYGMQIINDCKLDCDTLLNLLFTGIKNILNNEMFLSNLDGKLYEMISAKGNQIISLLYSVNDGCLNADVVTFEECLDKPKKREFSINKNFMRKVDPQTSTYVIKNTKEKNTVSFFSAEKYSLFQGTKLYKLNELLNLFNKIYDGICNIEIENINMNERKFKSISAKNRFYRDKSLNFVLNIGLNIIDNVGDEEAVCLIESSLSARNIPFCKSNDLICDRFNLNIIHNKENCDECNDKYVKSDTIVVQNITYEDSLLNKRKIIVPDKFDKDLLEVIASEMVHKYEMNKKIILQYNTTNVFLDKYKFGQVKKINDKYYRFELSIDKGKMHFSCDDINESKFIKEMLYIKNKNNNSIIEVEVLKQYPIVDTNKLNEDYKKCYHKIVIINDLIKKIISIKNKRKKYIKVLDEFVEYISKYNIDTMFNLRENIKRDVFPIEKENKAKYVNALKYLNIDLYEEYGWFFNPLWRRNDSPYKTTFTNFKYRYDCNNGLIYYSANCSSPKIEMVNGLPFRRIRTTFTEEEIENYLELLDVDNIRNGQNTVIPFPFKYLREYIRLMF